MNPVTAFFLLSGSLLALLAGVGLLKFTTTYARLHAAGKASPVAFLLVAFGAGVELGWSAGAQLLVAAVAMVLTFPVAVHLLFRAVHRTTSGDHLVVDELGVAERLGSNDDSG